MIKIENVSKKFGSIQSLSQVTAQIKQSSIFGLIGSNGSGKSTLMRIMCGIFRPDTGMVSYEDVPVYENTIIKQQIIYLSDENYFFPHATLQDMMRIYHSVYQNFSVSRYEELTRIFSLETGRKLNTFSKGMQKQAAILLALAAKPHYLLCDETFDGLDPVMRQLVKRLLVEDVAESQLTPIIASHNLRELEDICDHVGLLHKGGILFERELDDMKLNIHKIQAVFETEIQAADLKGLKIVRFTRRGSLVTLVVRGQEAELNTFFKKLHPIFYEMIPLTLEEIFISEMEDRGYDFSKILV